MSNSDTHIRIDGNSIEGVNDWILMSSKVLYGATKHGVYLAAGNIYRTTLSNISSAPFKSDNLIKGVKYYFDNINNASNMFTTTTLSEESLYNVVESFKTIPDTLNPGVRNLYRFGLSEEQIATIKTLSNWPDLEALGWTE